MTDFEDRLRRIMKGEVTEDQIAAFLTDLRNKGETKEELLTAARVLRECMVKVSVAPDNLVDTCGTGGDEKGTFNISTAATFVVAGVGVRVAKHGNRSVSSKCGSADLLEAAGVKIDCEPVVVRRSLQEAGIGFFFAPLFHPAMKNVATARKKVGRSIFNLLGPLINPAQPLSQVVGIYDRSRIGIYCEVLRDLGSKHVLVVCGEDGLDEITLTGKTSVCELKEGRINTYEIDPREYDLSLCKSSDLAGRDAVVNASLLRGILEGYLCPLRDAVILNAAAALVAADRAKDLGEGIVLANRSLDQGKAYECLKKLVEVTNA